jgi:hypothetical protein
MKRKLADRPEHIVSAFWDQCAQLKMDHELFGALFISGEKQNELLRQSAPLFFDDLYRLMRNSLFIQFCRITDPPGSGSRINLTSNYILDAIPWSPDVRAKLEEINKRLMRFRAYVDPARNKRLAHADLRSELDKVTLGKFPTGADDKFLHDLEEFLTVAQESLGEPAISLTVGGAHDAHALVRALVESRLYNSCAGCAPRVRIEAVLDYERDQL